VRRVPVNGTTRSITDPALAARVSARRDTPRITPWLDLVAEGPLTIEEAVDLALQAAGLLDERRRRDPTEYAGLEAVLLAANTRADAILGRAA
jgi:hypothetical protein